MSSSNAIAIPKRKGKQPVRSSDSSSSFSSTPTSSSERSGGFATPGSSSNRFSYISNSDHTRFTSYGKYGSPSSSSASTTPSTSPNGESNLRRRESLMSATFSAQEHTVINVGEEESPRLITCVKASQGFDWNQEIFLPSYADYRFDDLERRQDPVEDIILTEEEVRNMFPQ